MYCNHCGSAIQSGQPYCSKCGRPVSVAYPRPAARGRVAEHLSILGALWFAVAGLSLIGGMFMVAFSGMPMTRFYTPAQQQLIPFEQAHAVSSYLQAIFIGMAFVCFIYAVAAGLAGWGLYKRQPWARMIALILAFVALLSIPLGTALGIYTIWVLLAGNGEKEYRRLAASA